MRRPSILLPAISALLMLASSAPSSAKPARVKVGAFVVDIAKFNVADGSFSVDMYLNFTAVSGELPKNLAFEFTNGRGKLDPISVGPKTVIYRVWANLHAPIDLRRYPFDKHALKIQLEDKRMTADELVYVPNKNEAGLDDEIVVMGWNVTGWKHRARIKRYPPNERFNRYVMSIELKRIGLTSVIKTFVPLLCFLLISFMTLMIEPEKADSRISINTGMMIASVMFHVAVASSLPPLGYLTLADRLMIATYVAVGFNLFGSVLMLQAKHRDQPERAKKIYQHSRFVVPAVSALAYGIAMVTTYL